MADKKYCIYCGAENSVTAETCVHCEQNLHPKESLLKDFLVERVKDELKGNLQDTIYDAIKNFLLSHLYGTVMTVSIVSYAVVATGVEVLADNRKKHIIPVNQPIVKVEEIRQEEKVIDYDRSLNVMKNRLTGKLTQEEGIKLVVIGNDISDDVFNTLCSIH